MQQAGGTVALVEHVAKTISDLRHEDLKDRPGMLYEEIEDNSNDIVAFEPMDGFGMQVRTNVHPHVRLHSSLALPIAPAFSLSYSSALQTQLRYRQHNPETLTSPTGPPPLPTHLPVSSFFVSAMLDPSHTLHVDYLHRYSKEITGKFYGVYTPFENVQNIDVCAKVVYDVEKYNVQVKTATDNQYLGVAFLRNFAKFWSMGSEVFYSNSQKSGGFSASCQYFNRVSPYRYQWTTTYNTMGDLASTFTSALVPSRIATASVRCTFNTNSHDSTLGVGIAYTPPLPISLRARWDSLAGWGVLATVRAFVGKLDVTCAFGVYGNNNGGRSFGTSVSIEI